MTVLQRDLRKQRRISRQRHKPSPDTVNLTPEEQHHRGMEAVIEERKIKRKIVVVCLLNKKPIPLMYSRLHCTVTEDTPRKISDYLYKRRLRDAWASSINKNTNLGLHLRY